MANQSERAVIDLVINGQQAQTTLKDLTLAVSRAKSELIKMKEADNPQLYAEKLENLHKLIGAQKDMTARINDTSTAWGRFKKEFATLAAGVVGGNLITFALQSLASVIPDTIDRTLKLKDSFADIEKATGLSAEGVKSLNKELKAIDTRTTNQELRDIAVAGGQLGVPTEQLKSFVENADKAVVALGDEFEGGVEQVAKSIGGIAKLFVETKNQDIGKSINDIGSALNELGAAGSATAPVVADFTARVGQLGKLAPAITETMGLGAAFQELGLTAEIASSGLSNVLLTASTKTELFAQQLRMTTKETEALINTSPNEFLLQLAASFQGLSATQVAQRMKDLKLESQEAVKVMSILADQTDFVREKQQLAAKAMSEGTSLTNEFSKKNHQLARDLKDLKEWFNGLFTSEALQNFLVEATHSAVAFTKALPKIGEWLGVVTDNFGLIATAATIYYGATIKATAAVIANVVAEGYRKIAYEVGFRWLVIQTAATQAYEVAVLVLTGQISLQTAVVAIARNAWAAFNAIMIANPIGLVVTALTALAYAVKYYSDNTERALEVERQNLRLKRDMSMAHDINTLSLQRYNEKLDDYLTMSQQERADVVKTIAMSRLDAEARLARLKVREKENEMLALEPSLWQTLWATMKGVANPAAAADAFAQAAHENVMKIRNDFSSGIQQLEQELKGYDSIFKRIQQYEKPTITGGGSSPKTITDPDKKPKKAAKSEEQKDAEELEKMLADARRSAMTAEGGAYEKSVAAFAEKYTKMYGLAKDNGEKINEIQRLSLIEWAGIEKQYYEDQDKADEKARKDEYDKAVGFLEEYYAEAQLDADNKLDLEKTYLEAKLLLEETYGQKTLSTRQAINRNLDEADRKRTEQAKEHTHHEKQQSEERKRMAELETKYRNDLFGASVSALKGFFSQSSGMQRAMLIAEKAWAVAQIGIGLAKQIAQINQVAIAIDAVSFGTGGSLYQVPAIIKASALAGAQVAAIAAQTFSAPAFIDGGFTGDVNPSGFYSRPTLFTDKGFSVAENSRPEFVVSNPALQVPVVANFARMLDVAQRSGDYSALTQSLAAAGGSQAPEQAAPASGGQTDLLLAQLIREQQMTRATMADYASRPVENNYRTFEKYQQRIQEIRQSVSL